MSRATSSKKQRVDRTRRAAMLDLESLERRELLSDIPTIVGLTRLDDEVTGHLKVAIDFSESMNAESAGERARYAVAASGGAGLKILSASYEETPTLHRVTLVGTTIDGKALPGGSYEVRVDGPRLKSLAGVAMSLAGDELAAYLPNRNVVATIGTLPGLGPFVESETSLGYTAPENLVAIDLNGDDLPDLATTSSGLVDDNGSKLGQIVVLMNEGGGRFAAPRTYGLDAQYGAQVVHGRDWDGDGDVDLVVTAIKSHYFEGSGEKVYVFLNDGTGELSRAPETPFTVTHTGSFTVAPSYWNDVANVLGDASGPELVMYQQGFFNQYSGGESEGKLQIIGQDPFLGYNRILTVSLGAAMQPTEFAHGDFNGDGRDDIVTGDITGAYVVLTTPTGVAPGVKLAFDGLYSGKLRVGDVNGDGKLDIVNVHDDYSNLSDVHDGSIISVFLGDGAGHFTNPPGQILGRRGSSLAGLADFNGDGKLDVLLTETWNDGPTGGGSFNWPDVDALSAWVWVGDGRGGFQPIGANPNPLPGLPFNIFTGPTTVAVADLDGDGDLDAAFGVAGIGSIPILLNDGAGRLSRPAVSPPDLGSYYKQNGANGATVADLNLDGLPDLIKLSSNFETLGIYLGRADGTHAIVTTLTTTVGALYWAEAGDVNGDETPDVVFSVGNFYTNGTRIGVAIGGGDGTFGTPAYFETGTNYAKLGRLIDVNGDGKLDVIASLAASENGSGGNGYGVLFGDGTGKLFYNPNTFIERGEDFLYQQYMRSYLTLGDFDGDARIDILEPAYLAGESRTVLRLLHGNGNGTFTPTVNVPFDGNYAFDYFPGDFDADGKLDAIGTYGENIYVFLNDGTGRLSRVRTISTGGNILAAGAVGDFNSDGKLDFGVGSSYSNFGAESATATTGILEGDGQGGFGPLRVIEVGDGQSLTLRTFDANGSLLAGSVEVVGTSTFALSVSTLAVAEGIGQVRVTVARDAALGTGTVSYGMLGVTATSGLDYTHGEGTLSFGVGEFSRSFDVAILDDSTVEPDETFRVQLTSVTGSGMSLGSPSSLLITILDDDVPPPAPGAFQFTAAASRFGESDASHAITVSRVGGSDGAASVLVGASGGTATAGSDYAFAAVRLSFAAGEASKTVSVRILPDALAEGDETFDLVLSDPTGGATVGAPARSTVTIADDDLASPLPSTIQFAPAAYVAGEASGSAVVIVTRIGDTSSAASVRYAATGGSATEGSDYAIAAGLLDFAPGQANRTIVLSLRDDTTDEPDETIVLSLSQPTGAGVSLGDSSSATITLLDDDEPAPPPDNVAPSVIAFGSNREGNKVVGLAIRFSEPLDPASARNVANYKVDNATKGGKASVVQSATYDATSNTVLLRISGWNSVLKAKNVTVKNLADRAGNSLTTSSARLSQSILASLKSPTIVDTWGPPKQWKPLPKVKPPAKGTEPRPAASYFVGSVKVDRIDRSNINGSLDPAVARGVVTKDLTALQFEFLPNGEFRVRATFGYVALGTYSVSKGVVSFRAVKPPKENTLFDFIVDGKLAIPSIPSQAAKVTVGISCTRGDSLPAFYIDYGAAATLTLTPGIPPWFVV